jgi:hypothetical protein
VAGGDLTRSHRCSPRSRSPCQAQAEHKETSTVTYNSPTYIAPGQYFVCYTALDAIKVAVYYNVDGVHRDPLVTGATEIEVSILSTDSPTSIATKTATAMTASGLFTSAVGVANVLTITNLANGAATDIANGAAPYGVCTGVQRRAPTSTPRSTSGPTTSASSTGARRRRRSRSPGRASRSASRSRRSGSRAWANVRVVLYRTKNNGTVFHRLTPIASPIANVKTADSVTATTASRATRTSRPSRRSTRRETRSRRTRRRLQPARDLQGSRLPRRPGGRLRAPLLDGDRRGEAVAFNDTLSVTVDQRGGPITALAVLDDKLLIFKESAIFALAGDGPSNTGAGQDYGAPR